MTAATRVIHYYPRFNEHRSGVTESIAGWSTMASAQGVQVEVWCATGARGAAHRDAETLSRADIPVIATPHAGRNHRTFVPTLWPRQIGRGDIVYVHEGWVVSNALTVRWARRRGASVVTMPHGAYAPQVVTATRDVLSARKQLERAALRQVDAAHLFFASEAAEVAAVAGREVPSGIFPNPAPDVAECEKWRGDGNYFLWIGRYDVRHKGLDILLDGWAALPMPRPRLVLAGPDYLGGKSQTRQLVTDLGLDADVVLKDSVVGQDKNDLMRSARGFIHSSRWDACSMILLEAMAIGLPCLVSSSVHAATTYAERGAALTFASSADFPRRVPELARAAAVGGRAATFMASEMTRAALAPAYYKWLGDLVR